MVDAPEMSTLTRTRFAGISPFVLIDKYLFPSEAGRGAKSARPGIFHSSLHLSSLCLGRAALESEESARVASATPG
jgi:hypothetical protein